MRLKFSIRGRYSQKRVDFALSWRIFCAFWHGKVFLTTKADRLLARVNAAFIQYLMTDFDGKRVLAEQYKQDYLKMLVKEFPKNSLVCNQLAGLLVAWRFFCAFAFKMKAINNNESKELRRVVRQRMIDLADEQKTISSINPGSLFNELPEHLAKMALFKVSTGCREQEVCSLRWEWEEYIPELKASVFVIPAHVVKNRMARVVVLNSEARAVIDQLRGRHPEYVFTYKGNRVLAMNNTA